MKNIHRSIIIVSLIALLLCFVFLIKPLVGYMISKNIIKNGTSINYLASAETPEEAINKRLELFEQNNYEEYKIKDVLYICENDEFYAEFFLAEDDMTVWYFLLEKANKNDTIIYTPKTCYSNLSLHIGIEEEMFDNYTYMVVESIEDTLEYEDADVIEYEIKIAEGKETQFLIINKSAR